MKSVLIAAVSAVQAYLLGSIDTGILVSKFLYHDDVRKYGSGAAGMTNMLRTFGKKAAALTAFGDVLKGVLAVCIGRWLFTLMPESATLSPYLAVYLAAIFAIIGHLKPLYFGFKGGKGIACTVGAIAVVRSILVAPVPPLPCFRTSSWNSRRLSSTPVLMLPSRYAAAAHKIYRKNIWVLLWQKYALTG